MQLSTFDIFDTTLIRICGKPENVIPLLAQRLFPKSPCRQREFLLWRNKAPSKVKNEYNLDDIYEEKGVSFFDEYIPKQMREAEKQLESDLLIGNVEVISQINKCRNAGHQIAFISDMYLPSSFLRGILVREGAYKEGDGLFVSNEIHARKDSGTLYDFVRVLYNNPTEWTHYGDNKESDYRMPRSKHIKAVLVDTCYNFAEKVLVENSKLLPSPSDLSILAGISRAARHKYGNSNEITLAANFVAPVYVPYVMYVLKDAKERGLDTLFFVSRDGFILQKIGECLPHNGIHLKYVFLSRQSLQKAFFYNASDDELEVTEKEAVGGNRDEYIEDYNNCCGYLKQEGLFNDKIGLVDIGWSGTSRVMINSLRKANGYGCCFTYYWGTNAMMRSSKYGDYDIYHSKLNTHTWQTFLMENYFSACPWSTTIGYVLSNDIYKPILEKNEYIEDVVVKTNTLICEFISTSLSQVFIHDVSLYIWMTKSLDQLLRGNSNVNWENLYKRYNDKEYCFRPLTMGEILKYICRNDKGDFVNIDVCLDLTIGHYWRDRINVLRKIFVNMFYFRKSLLCYFRVFLKNI